ncbi:SET domain-containing protein, partial [Meira miltonrushii]
QTIEHLPLAKDEALRTFEEMKDNWYQNHKVGRSRGYEKEAMVCECHYRHGADDPMMACGEDAGCINRLTQVECRASDCNCGDYCQNRRFQNHEYVNVEIVQTEKKGFGLRAAQAVPTDRLIYEYIGEVVEQSEFMRRMQQYKDEGIRHYYFMMLQREEFLDATKKGGIARFINHSCNPNCYVSKWHVGKHMRMGIFSKRDIIPGEELTFNYNVDRYGNEAQTCYCGEPNCVGAIGGKTQTDIGGMDELFIDALGITEEVDRLEARGTRKKKSRHLDEDFNPTLRPMEEDEVAKMITAIRQAASNRTILQKLITRIHMTSDTDVQRNLVQLHGFVLMAGILDEWKDDKEIVLLVMGSLARWPLIARNKVVDSGVDKLVKEFSEMEDTELSSLAKDLLSAWDALEMSYRIARKENDKSSERHTLSFAQRKADDVDDVAPRVTLAEARAPNTISRRLENVAPKPLIHPGAEEESRYSGYRDHRRGNDNWQRDRRTYESEAAQRKKAEEAAAAATAEASMRRTESIEKRPSLAGMKRRSTTKLSSDKRRRTNEPSGNQEGDKESALGVAEKRLKMLLGEIVVRCMSHHKDDLDRDAFKKHAKDLTTILCEKEKRNPKVWPPAMNDRGEVKAKYLPDGFSSEKKGKIKSFANDYIRKLIAHKARKQSTNG